MAPPDAEVVTPVEPEAELRQLFGDYKAEWLRNRLFDLFAEPAYFPSLDGARPCFLMGGRGTGKTTVLKGLSHLGTYHLSDRGKQLAEWEYVGLYYRVNSNRVAPFRGPELSAEQWDKVFAHYLNLTLADLLLEFVEWSAESLAFSPEIPESEILNIGISLGLSEQPTSLASLRVSVALASARFEQEINNVGDGIPTGLSVGGAPIDRLSAALLQGPLENKVFTFLLDEYENLDERQQRVVNTLIKHSGTTYTFKIGVKEGGLRTRATLVADQFLQDPADFALIDITGSLLQAGAFRDFAERVCNARLGTIVPPGGARIDDVTALFTSLSADDEADLLGVRKLAEPLRTELTLKLEGSERLALDRFTDLELYVLHTLATGDADFADTFRDALGNDVAWRNRYSNYRQALLYTVRRRKVGIRKYFAGWETVVQLAAGNIRLLMELVEACFVMNHQSNKKFGSTFDPALQTLAFQQVGRKNLTELNSSVYGARLSRLLLGLGRIFGVLAADPLGHAPEVTQFRIADHARSNDLFDHDGSCPELLDIAVMELVLIRQPGTKLTAPEETREDEYRVHPVFSPFFVFPSGRKRRITVSCDQLLLLTTDTRGAIRRVLRQVGRTNDEPVPESLAGYEELVGSAD